MPATLPNSLSEGGGVSALRLLERNTPGYPLFKKFFATWLRVDITLLASILTVLGIATNAVGKLNRLALKVYYWIYKFMIASVSIPSSDRLNREVLNWIGANVLSKGGQLVLTANTEIMQSDAWSFRRARRERNDFTHEKRVPINYLPTFGTTWFFWQRRFFMVKRMPGAASLVHRSRDSSIPAEYVDAPEGNEPLVVLCLGRSLDPIKRFLEECRDFAEQQRASYITVRSAKTHWDTTILRPMRSFETVHFDEDEKASLIQDVMTYLDAKTRQFYNARGIPYRRGYLLHGPPGTGKTSLSLAIASQFKLDLYLLHVPSVRDDSDMERLFTCLPPRCVVLLEDIDAVGVRRKGVSDDSEGEGDDADDASIKSVHSRCTLSGLLNVLDGVASQEGRIVLMTSNHADKLDPALIRPGRIDRIIYLGNLSQRSAELMFLRMYAPDPNSPPVTGTENISHEKLNQLATEFGENIADKVFTPAQVQGYLLGHRHSPIQAVKEVAEWSKRTRETMQAAAAKSKKAAAKRNKNVNARNLKLLGKAMTGFQQPLQALIDNAPVEKGTKAAPTACKNCGSKRENGSESTEKATMPTEGGNDTQIGVNEMSTAGSSTATRADTIMGETICGHGEPLIENHDVQPSQFSEENTASLQDTVLDKANTSTS